MSRLALLLALSSMVLACGSPIDAPADVDTANDAGPESDAASSRAPSCPRPDEGVAKDATCIESLRAKVVDDEGQGLADLVVTLCGDGCVFGSTGNDGVLDMKVGTFMRKPALMIHGRSKHASYYVRVESQGAVDLGTLVAPKMPASSTKLPSSSGGTVSSGDVTLIVPPGAKVEIDVLELEEPHMQTFSARRVPLDASPPWARTTPGLVALWALNPFATNVEPGAKVRLRNVTGLASGTRVDILVHAASVTDAYGPFASFVKMAEGRVTADGGAIESEGFAVRHLTWIGVRKK